MSFTPLAFTGISTYSTDFQTILTRAVNIASIPLKSLQNQDSDIIQQKAQLTSLSGAVGGLGASLATLAGFGANKALSAFSSNSSAVTVRNASATAQASYTINSVTSLSAVASETSLVGYADGAATPVSATGSVKLTVGSNSQTIDLTGKNNLVGLRDAINNLGIGATASILTAGSSNYLSISTTAAGLTTLTLKDDPLGTNTDLLTATNQGKDTVFELNGIPITRQSNTVNDLIPGLAFTLVAPTASPVTLSLSTDRSRISTALQDFVSNYNAATAAVGQQVGPAAGLLSGDFLVRQIQEQLRQVSAYSGSTATVRGFGALGVSFDATGKATFDADVFAQLPDSTITDAFTFFGSATTGLGELAGSITQITDPVSGLAKIQQDSYDQTDIRLNKQISLLTEQIGVMQNTLSAKLQAADALLAQLSSQQQILTASIQSVNLVTFGKNTAN